MSIRQALNKWLSTFKNPFKKKETPRVYHRENGSQYIDPDEFVRSDEGKRVFGEMANAFESSSKRNRAHANSHQ